MTTGYQIYKYSPKFDECFVDAGLINWFSTLAEAEERKSKLDATWNKHGVQYVIVKCHE